MRTNSEFGKYAGRAVIAALLFCLQMGVAAAYTATGGNYELLSSVVDNGGGEKLTGSDYMAKGAIAQVSLPDNIGVTSAGEYVNRVGFYNPPYFTYQAALPTALSMNSGNIGVNIPANAVDKAVFDLILNNNPMNAPISVDPSKITEAMNKMLANEGQWAQMLPNCMTEMGIFDEQSFYEKPLAAAGTLTMKYNDTNDDGVLDGSNPPVRTDSLNAWTLDNALDMWVKLHNVNEDPSNKTFTVYFGMPGVYAMLGALDQAVKNVFAFPVPFRPNGPLAGSGQGNSGTEADGITFANLPQKGDIEIYTLDGRLVRKISIPINLVIPKVRWDVRNSAGDKAASGVYIWRVVSGSSSKTGKLMVIW